MFFFWKSQLKTYSFGFTIKQILNILKLVALIIVKQFIFNLYNLKIHVILFEKSASGIEGMKPQYAQLFYKINYCYKVMSESWELYFFNSFSSFFILLLLLEKVHI